MKLSDKENTTVLSIYSIESYMSKLALYDYYV